MWFRLVCSVPPKLTLVLCIDCFLPHLSESSVVSLQPVLLLLLLIFG